MLVIGRGSMSILLVIVTCQRPGLIWSGLRVSAMRTVAEKRTTRGQDHQSHFFPLDSGRCAIRLLDPNVTGLIQARNLVVELAPDPVTSNALPGSVWHPHPDVDAGRRILATILAEV